LWLCFQQRFFSLWQHGAVPHSIRLCIMVCNFTRVQQRLKVCRKVSDFGGFWKVCGLCSDTKTLRERRKVATVCTQSWKPNTAEAHGTGSSQDVLCYAMLWVLTISTYLHCTWYILICHALVAKVWPESSELAACLHVLGSFQESVWTLKSLHWLESVDWNLISLVAMWCRRLALSPNPITGW
jgi:hypothetical protein